MIIIMNTDLFLIINICSTILVTNYWHNQADKFDISFCGVCDNHSFSQFSRFLALSLLFKCLLKPLTVKQVLILPYYLYECNEINDKL